MTLGLSLVFGAARFNRRIRQFHLVVSTDRRLSIIFGPAVVAAFAVNWLQGVIPLIEGGSGLVPAFFYVGFAWFLVLSVVTVGSSVREIPRIGRGTTAPRAESAD